MGTYLGMYTLLLNYGLCNTKAAKQTETFQCPEPHLVHIYVPGVLKR